MYNNYFFQAAFLVSLLWTITSFGQITPDVINLPDLNEECQSTPIPPTANSGTLAGVSDLIFPISSQGTTIVTWTYDDGNGNTASQTQNIIVSYPTLYADTDNDSFGDPNNTIQSCVPVIGYVENNNDCDDSNAYVYLDAAEVGDGLDNNCDGLIDNTICFTSNADNDTGVPFIFEDAVPPPLFANEYASSNDAGFGPWISEPTHFLWSSGMNASFSDGLIDSQLSLNSWGFGHPNFGSGPILVMRTFDSVLGIGDSFSMDFDHPTIENSACLFSLKNSQDEDLVRFSYNFGSQPYSINSMVSDLTLANSGLNILIERISTTNFIVTITSLEGGSSDTIPITVTSQYNNFDTTLIEFTFFAEQGIFQAFYMNNFEICHGPSTIDEDNDGYANDIDCDDNDATINPFAQEICDGKDNDCNGIIDDNVIDNEEEVTWNGSVSSDWDDPSNWTPNIVPFECAEITIPLTVNPPLIIGEKTVRHLNISSGSSFSIPAGAILNISGDVNMYSVSNTFSGLIVNGTIAIGGSCKYHRYTNTQADGNDLISPPLLGQTWSSFLTNDANYNADFIFNNGVQPMTTYLFGPFEKGTIDNYVLYTDNSTEELISGKGYRSATNSVNGEALIFTGSIVTGAVNSTILNETTGDFPEWNLIGNPYPAYIDVSTFLNHIGSVSGVTNLNLLDTPTAAIYGYDADDTDVTGSNWTIANLVEGPALIAPGQGFFVSSKFASATIEFTPDMQVVGAADDFIQGRITNATDYIKLIATTGSKSATTSLYFHENGTTGLDIGYDASIFGGTTPEFSLYSHLVSENEGIPMAIQTLSTETLSTTVVPLGLNVSEGEQVTISLGDYYIPDTISVYLEDNSNNTYTLLNTTDYVLTTNLALNGTGRFYLHFVTEALSIGENNFKGLNIYTNQAGRTVVIEGVLVKNTEAIVFDALGRAVMRQGLNSLVNKNVIDASALSTGVYIINLRDGTMQYSQKLILN